MRSGTRYVVALGLLLFLGCMTRGVVGSTLVAGGEDSPRAVPLGTVSMELDRAP